MASQEFEFEINFGADNSSRKFNTIAELVEFLETQIEFYRWIEEANSTLFQQLRANFPKRLRDVLELLRRFQRESAESLVGGARNDLNSIYYEKKLPHDNSKLGNFLSKLAESNVNAAAAALSAWTGISVQDERTAVVAQGRTLLSLHLSPFLDLDYASAADALIKLEASHNSEIRRLKEIQKESLKEGNDRIAKHSEHFDNITKEKETRWEELETEISDAVTSLENTEKAYKEFMGLKAPVEYWSDKAEGHKIAVERNLVVLVLFALFGGGSLIGLLWGIANTALSWAKSDPPVAVFLTLATVGVAATTGVIWILRVMVRNYLSEKHLGIDAQERATMIQSYLAFMEAGQVETEERKILLQSIFRPTADGIVKDDAAPFFPGQNIISGS